MILIMTLKVIKRNVNIIQCGVLALQITVRKKLLEKNSVKKLVTRL